MFQGFVLLGDKTTHGGEVVSLIGLRGAAQGL